MPSGPQPKLDLCKRDLETLESEQIGEAKGNRPYQTLLLSNNRLQRLFETFATHCANLKVIYLNNNALEEFPTELCDIGGLIKLHLEHNAIRELPSSIGRLEHLKKLYVNDNRLETLPETIGHLRQLQVLALHNNRLERLPYHVLGCYSLTELSLRGNPIRSPPPFIWNKGLDWLRLYLRECAVSAEIGVPSADYVFHRHIELNDNDSARPDVGTSSSSPSASSSTATSGGERPTKPRSQASKTKSMKSLVKRDSRSKDATKRTFTQRQFLALNQNYLLYFLSDAHGTGVQGNRPYMEDRCTVLPRLQQRKVGDTVDELENLFSKIAYYGVYDGHGGQIIAEYLRRHLHATVVNQSAFRHGRFVLALKNAFRVADDTALRWCAENRKVDGSTCVVALVVDNQLITAHCGDSRAVLCRRKKAFRLTDDHKPYRPDEEARIREAGGRVTHSGGCYRVNGQLAVSRAFGDILLKGSELVTSEPEFCVEELTPDDELLVLASDGVWDVLTDQKAVDVARKCATAYEASQRICELSLRRGSNDNITVVVVKFKWALDYLMDADGRRADLSDLGKAMPGVSMRDTFRPAVHQSEKDDVAGGADARQKQQGTRSVFVQVLIPEVSAHEPKMQRCERTLGVEALTATLMKKYQLAAKDGDGDGDGEAHRLYNARQPAKALARDATIESLDIGDSDVLVLRRPGDEVPTDVINVGEKSDEALGAASKAELDRAVGRLSLAVSTIERSKRGAHASVGSLSAVSTADSEAATSGGGDGGKPQTVSFANLPPNWAETQTTDGRTFFFNVATRETSWQRPPFAMPRGWTQHASRFNKVYYSHKDESGVVTTSWTLPAEEVDEEELESAAAVDEEASKENAREGK